MHLPRENEPVIWFDPVLGGHLPSRTLEERKLGENGKERLRSIRPGNRGRVTASAATKVRRGSPAFDEPADDFGPRQSYRT
jgi:hypothetical protein